MNNTSLIGFTIYITLAGIAGLILLIKFIKNLKKEHYKLLFHSALIATIITPTMWGAEGSGAFPFPASLVLILSIITLKTDEILLGLLLGLLPLIVMTCIIFKIKQYRLNKKSSQNI